MSIAGTILLVDDEAKIRELLTRALVEEGHEVVQTSNASEARQLLGRRLFDLLIVDNLMPDMTGLDLIRQLAGTVPESERPQILMMTAHATVESAIAAMKLGALDYLQKPFEIDELLVVVTPGARASAAAHQHGYLIAERDEEFNHYGIAGRSRLMQEVIRTARAGRADQEHRPHHRRDRDRQGARGARHPRAQRRARSAAHQGQLRGHSRDPARVRAVRPRQGRLHRCNREQEGAVRAGRRRHAVPRRDCDDERRAPGQAAAGAAGARVRAARVGEEPARRRAGDCGHQPRPAADGARRPLPGGSRSTG